MFYDDFTIAIVGTSLDNLLLEKTCEDIRMEEFDPYFPQPDALRSPNVILCTARFPDGLESADPESIALKFNVPDWYRTRSDIISISDIKYEYSTDSETQHDPWTQDSV